MTLPKDKSKQTPLSQMLAAYQNPQVIPLELFKKARRAWIKGKRVDINNLADEIGISRVTFNSWVPDKRYLLEEIIWSLAKETFEQAIKETPGHGIDHIVNVHRRFMKAIVSYRPLQQFIREKPANAISILRNVGSKEHMMIKVVCDHLSSQAAQGHIALPTTARKLAEIIVSTNGALIFTDLLAGLKPNIDRACIVTRVLLLAEKIVVPIYNP